MNKILTVLLFFLTFVVKAQKLPDVFKVAKYCEILPGDSIKIWYNCTGSIANSECAAFYRVGKIDPNRIGITGKFSDYDLKGNVMYKAQIINGYLERAGCFFYSSGKIREVGGYVKGKRYGTWSYYYENGRLAKTLVFNDESVDIIEQYTEDGKQLVVNGNGMYSGRFNGYKDCSIGFPISGSVKNGKMDGAWRFDTLATEIYKEGNFVSNASSAKPAIEISGFYANENAVIEDNTIGCPGDRMSLFMYHGKTLSAKFYPELIKTIKDYGKLQQQCILVSISFKKNKISNVDVYSSKNDENLERLVSNYIANLSGWLAGHSSGETNPPLFFSINVDPSLGDEIVLIPAEYRNRKMGLFGAR